MTITLRSATQSGATTKGSALTHDELDGNFQDFMSSGGSAHVGYIQSGTGALARTMQDVERAVARSADFSTAANFNTYVDTLTETFAVAALNVGKSVASTNWTITGQYAAFPQTAVNFIGVKNPTTKTVHQTNYFVVLGQDDNNTTDNIAASYAAFYENHSSGTRASSVAFEGDVFHTGVGSTTGIAGVLGFTNVSAGTVFTDWGIQGEIVISGGTVTHAAGGYSIVLQSGGTVTNSYGFIINPRSHTGGTVTNNYGLYIDNVGTNGGTLNYQLYSYGSGGAVIIDNAGNLGIGAAPTKKFHITSTDTNPIALIAGATKALRIGANSAGAVIEGVDNTGSASYQPLSVGGSAVTITGSGSTIAVFTAGVQVGTPTGGDKGAGTINAAGAYYANGTAGVASYGPAAVASITVKNGIVTAVS